MSKNGEEIKVAGEGRTANSKRNIIFGMIQVGVKQVLPFIVRTILIYRFGVEYLGLNSLFTSILSVLSLMELGFGSAIVYSMYKPVADGDTEQICAYLGYFRKMYQVIGLGMLGAGIALMPFLHYLVQDPKLPGDLNLYVCYLIFLSNSVISYLLFGYMSSIPTAYQQQDLLSKIDIGIAILSCIARSLILLFSKNFYFYLVCGPLFTVVQNIYTAHLVKRRYPGIECRGKLSAEQKKNLNKRIYGLLVDRLTNVSRNGIDSLCISALIGLSITGSYNNYLFIMTAVHAFTFVIGHSMTPSVGNSIALESREKNYHDLRLFDFLYMAITGWTMVCMLCLYQPFIRLWVGESMLLDIPVMVGMCLYFYVLVSGDMNWAYVMGAGMWYECRFVMISEAAVNVVLNILLCRIMGVQGIVLATILSVFATNCVFVPKVIFREYFRNGKLQEYWVDHAEYAMTMVLTAGLSWMACEYAAPMRMIDGGGVLAFICLVGRLVVCSVLAVGVFWGVWHRSKRYARAVVWVKRMIRA